MAVGMKAMGRRKGGGLKGRQHGGAGGGGEKNVCGAVWSGPETNYSLEVEEEEEDMYLEQQH